MPNLNFSPTAQAQSMPAMAPMAMAPVMPTAPHDGVIATRPATMPEAAPSDVDLPCRIRSISSQPSMAAQVAIVVLRKVTPVSDMNCAVSSSTTVGLDEDQRADVEAVPAEPQQAGADHGEGQVVRLHRLPAEADPLADDQREHEPGDTGVDVHDRPAGVVLRREVLGDEADTGGPHLVGDREVAERDPERDEHDPGRELDAVGDRTRDERHRDGGEGHLEHDAADVALPRDVLERRRRRTGWRRGCRRRRRRRPSTSPTARRRCRRCPAAT